MSTLAFQISRLFAEGERLPVIKSWLTDTVWRPQGTSSRKLYQHGGFSLMEVLVPWIELEPRG